MSNLQNMQAISAISLEDARAKIDRAVTQLQLSEPWWSYLLLHLKREASSPERGIDTFATDGTSIFWNPSFVLSLSEREILAVLVHEVAHCVLGHMFRRGMRQPLAWNIACDRVVNRLILDSGYILPGETIPPAADLSFIAEDLYKEDISEFLYMFDVRDPGELVSRDGENRNSDHMTSRNWKEVLKAAHGTVPAAFSRLIEDIIVPSRDWREELEIFCHSRVPDADTTWMRPSRRIAGMPGRLRVSSATIALVVDTSGSIDKVQCDKFMSYCKKIAELQRFSVVLISADAAVHETILPGEAWPTQLLGGGGTSFGPAIAVAKSLCVDGIVYFTDGDGDFPERPQLPILWVLTKTKTVPYGYTTIIK